MLGTQAFFSFSRLNDDRRHREYNEWHQLDHVPEVLTDPDVAAAARWVRSPVCAAATVSAGSLLGSLQYVTMYWYRRPGPLGRLAPLHFQLGRRADLDVGHSLMAGVFRPVKGYVSPRIALGPDVIPLRPARGVYLRVDECQGGYAELGQAFRWSDRERLPTLIAAEGVVGAWLFVDSDYLAGVESAPLRRIEVFYLDAEPVGTSKRLAQLDTEIASRHGDPWPTSRKTLFAGPLAVNQPWQWDWFDE